MVDHNDRDQGPDDLYDEAAPRSIFAATWFRAVLVLIVLGVIGAVAVPYILDAMNAPPGKLSATAPSPPPSQPPPAMPPVAATPTPAAPPTGAPAGVTSTPSTPGPATAPPPPSPTASDKPSEKKDAMIAGATPAPEPAKAEPRPTPAAETAAKPEPGTTAKATAPAPRAAAGRQWFVQVGAFKDPATAKKVAAKLREDKYKVDESMRGTAAATVAKATTAPPSDRYDVIVSGQSPAELSQRLAAKGLTAEAADAGTIVRPSLPLRDAVALSKDLAVDGLKVQVRRAGGSASTSRAARASASAGGGDGLHRVSVGGFAERATALATLKELEAKGYKPFLTRR